jgi:hypothetical protein
LLKHPESGTKWLPNSFLSPSRSMGLRDMAAAGGVVVGVGDRDGFVDGKGGYIPEESTSL